MTRNILIVDDDRDLSRSLANLFDGATYRVTQVETGARAEAYVRERGDVDVALVDVNLPDTSGLELLKKLRSSERELPVIIISGQVSTDNAIEAMREGAYEYLAKPFEIERLIGVVNRACGSAKSATASREEPVKAATKIDTGELIGRSPEIVEIAKLVGQLAHNDANVLICGESGTGKELVARSIHRNSPRRNGTFVTVNCSTMTDSLFESEIFGHEKGAFASAYFRRLGKLEQANKGTLFFDEIADLSPAMQTRLLRTLDENSFERMGGAERLHSDTRIIAATAKSLAQAVKNGAFRVDLFYRLKVASIYMPPLRERKGDIDLLADYFLKRLAMQAGLNAPHLSKEARIALEKYSWPGNVRELENNLHSALVMSKGGELRVEDLPISVEQNGDLAFQLPEMQMNSVEMFQRLVDPLMPKLAASHEGRIYDVVNSAMERALISSALRLYGSNQVRTAEALGISRNTLRDRVSKYNLH